MVVWYLLVNDRQQPIAAFRHCLVYEAQHLIPERAVPKQNRLRMNLSPATILPSVADASPLDPAVLDSSPLYEALPLDAQPTDLRRLASAALWLHRHNSVRRARHTSSRIGGSSSLLLSSSMVMAAGAAAHG
jgi:hypothetical protein